MRPQIKFVCAAATEANISRKIFYRVFHCQLKIS